MPQVDEHFIHPRLVPLYDLTCGWGEDRQYYYSLAGKSRKRVLELGAGTGLIARKLAAAGHDVTAVDPSDAMLGYGKKQPHGDKVLWVRGTAQSFSLRSEFDFIFMTGHAFQVLLADEDMENALASIAHHLVPGGMFAFETRNPVIDWQKRWDGLESTIQMEPPVIQNTSCSFFDGEYLEFAHDYVFPDEVIRSESRLRFVDLKKLQTKLSEAGFAILNLYGDWQKNPVSSGSSELIIQARRETPDIWTS